MSDVSTALTQPPAVQGSMEKLATPLEEAAMDQLYSDLTFVDDVMGRVLDKALALEARKKETQYLKTKGVYTKTLREAGMKTIATK